MKKRWWGLLIVGVFLAAGAYLVNAPWLSRTVLRHVLAHRPGVVVMDVRVGRQQLSLPGRVDLRDVMVTASINGKLLQVEAPAVTLTGLQSFFSGEVRFFVTAGNMLVRYDAGEAKAVRAELMAVADGVSGPFYAGEARWDKVQARDVAAFVIVNAAGLEARAVELAAYGGNVTGKVMVRSAGRTSYAAELLADGIDVIRLAEINPDIAAQLSGRVSGAVSFSGDPQTLCTLNTDLTMPAGGKVSASFLAALTQYLPQSREKKRLDLLIRNGGKLAMEAFSFTINGGQQGKFSGEIRLRSREINLELNLTHEINTDGTIAALIAYGQKFLK